LNQPTSIVKRGQLEIEDAKTAAKIVEITLIQFDNKMNTMNTLLNVLSSQMSKSFEEVQSASLSVDSKFVDVATIIGKKPKLISKDFDGPDMWSVMSEVISRVHDTPTRSEFQELLVKLNHLHKFTDTGNDRATSKFDMLKNYNQDLENKFADMSNNSNTIFRHIMVSMLSMK
jgi:hypothetical protein